MRPYSGVAIPKSEDQPGLAGPAGLGPAEPGQPAGQPPFAKRGVETPPPLGAGPLLTPAALHWKSIDFLTATVPAEVAEFLTGQTGEDEDGYGGRGFKASQKRICMGGYCWRRWDPIQPSKAWPGEYECWEWASSGSDSAAGMLRGRPCRPSRIDLAWDFSCPEGLTADAVAEQLRPWHEGRGLSWGISGKDGVNSRYVGSASSERRVRIYRKDLQDPTLGEILGPTMRVELVLRAEWAAEFWAKWDCDKAAAWTWAAGVMLDMTGLTVQTGAESVGPLPATEPSGEGAKLGAFLDQYAEQLCLWEGGGVNVLQAALAVVQAKDGKRGTALRVRRCKRKRRVERLRSVGRAALLTAAAAVCHVPASALLRLMVQS